MTQEIMDESVGIDAGQIEPMLKKDKFWRKDKKLAKFAKEYAIKHPSFRDRKRGSRKYVRERDGLNEAKYAMVRAQLRRSNKPRCEAIEYILRHPGVTYTNIDDYFGVRRGHTSRVIGKFVSSNNITTQLEILGLFIDKVKVEQFIEAMNITMNRADQQTYDVDGLIKLAQDIKEGKENAKF